MTDHVATILDAWRSESPGLDVTPVAVFGRVSRIERHLSQALRPVYRSYRLDPGEYDVLAALRRSGPPYRLSPTELYRSMLVTSATMTERLDRLERRQLIRRAPAPDDRRSILVQLTAQGRALFDKAHADLLAAEAALLDSLTQEERTALADLLARLAASLEAGPQTSPPGS
jgi:DNA-binding MarR family transcriptional regulator